MSDFIPSPEERVLIGGQPIPILWKRNTRARRVALKVDPQHGHIVITLPPRGSRRAGLSLLKVHEDWVAARLASLAPVMRLEAGRHIPVSGAPHLILHEPLLRGRSLIADGTIRVSGQPEFLARRVRDALKDLATTIFSAEAERIAADIDARPRRVRVKDTISRWGSCAPDGTLMFSWRLIMAPPFVQHYVIAHEIAHLRHMNHGPAFWNLTDRLTPYRAAASGWLSDHGPGLLRIA